jgi:hypothetical protein
MVSHSTLLSCCFENAAARIYQHPLGFVQHVWLPGSASSPALHAAFEALLAQLSPTGGQKVLIDQRQFLLPTPADTSWFLLDWLPRAVQQGYRYGAVLSLHPVLDRVSAHAIRQEAMHQFPVVYRSFVQEQAAITWLLTQP